ncbi:hypothetical protein ACFPYJ_07605 [Paenibacillus solisilvae]|uniref:RNA polymerase subunit sigma n=1 Tax=Paenibacillus solisilvae TaxID=2486751 RepID=A0ABW0VT58_9BACL
MPYRSIDLQMSIPRIPESGAQQSQTMHKPISDQTHLANEAGKQTERLRGKNSAIEQSIKMEIKDQQQQEASSPSKRKKHREPVSGQQDTDNGTEQAQKHPFKGKHIDISL